MNLGIIFEIVIIMMLTLASIEGYKRGLFLLVTKPVCLFIPFGITVLIYRQISYHASFVINGAVCFIIVLILSRVMCRFLFWLLARLLDIGIIGQINRLLGVILSFCIACFVVWIFVSFADYFMRHNGASAETSFEPGRLYYLFLKTSPLDFLLKFR